MNLFQAAIHHLEAGGARAVSWIVPLVVFFALTVMFYDTDGIDLPIWGRLGGVYHGLNDAQSMDNAQLARQISRGAGFTTEFIRPFALAQLNDYAAAKSLLGEGQASSLFPPDRYPPGTPRLLPDTYNAPLYPYLLAGWFKLVRPKFDQPYLDMAQQHYYSGDRAIPFLNQIFMVLIALLTFALGRTLFDERVAWMSMVIFLISNVVWQYSITGLSTLFLMFLITAALFAAMQLYQAAEIDAESANPPPLPVSFWIWLLLLAVLVGLACLTRLHLLVLLIPLIGFLCLLPRRSVLFWIPFAVIVLAMVIPWFWRTYTLSGNIVGSNLPLLLYGQGGFDGNQIYRLLGIPGYERLFKAVTLKEYIGLLWHLEHAWELLGATPLLLLFVSSLLHEFKRRRVQAFRWLIVFLALFIVVANNAAWPKPEAVSAWNTVIILFPAMLVIGSAFFFILLDRLNLMLRFLTNSIIILTLFISGLPLLLTLSLFDYKLYNYPPYCPPLIMLAGQYSNSDEWVTSDMPWATAWYADRPSLWMPETIADFLKIRDSICPSNTLLITPCTLDQPVLNLITGEDKDWFILALNSQSPEGFPLPVRVIMPAGGPQYILWCDHSHKPPGK